MNMQIPLKIAIDFDGTIVEHKYPEIGKEILFAFETIKALQKQKHQLILWTFRSGRELDEAERKVYDALREWRAGKARQEGIPPYMIANNSQLAKMVKLKAAAKADLAKDVPPAPQP